jgi:hypothetical protein
MNVLEYSHSGASISWQVDQSNFLPSSHAFAGLCHFVAKRQLAAAQEQYPPLRRATCRPVPASSPLANAVCQHVRDLACFAGIHLTHFVEG